MKQPSLIILLIVLGSATGCRPRFRSGVDPQKKGNELSPAEVQQLCEAGAGFQYDAFLDRRSLYCNLAGINLAAQAAADGDVTSDALAKTACIGARSVCNTAELPAREEFVALLCGDFTEAPECDSLVDDIEICATDAAIDRVRLAEAAPDCGQVTLDDLPNWELATPLTCDDVVRDCPEANEIIFGGPAAIASALLEDAAP